MTKPAGRVRGFSFESCNDQGYPAEVDPDACFNQIAATMVAHGWTDGPPFGLHPNGRVINKSADRLRGR